MNLVFGLLFLIGQAAQEPAPPAETYTRAEMIKLVEQGYRCGGLAAALDILGDDPDNDKVVGAMTRLYKSHHCAELEQMLDKADAQKALEPIRQAQQP